jgi:glycerophosphoryl diester phosphodiesterase
MGIRPLLLGHRGARGEKSAPENTVASFDLALAQSCDGFEFDVRLNGDGQAVICHDPVVLGRNIAESSSQDLVLPWLSELLARYQESAFLDIELKVAGLENIVAKLLREYTPSRGFVVSSFLPEVLQVLHGLDPSLSLGLICETQAELGFWRDLPIRYLIPHHKLLTPELLSELKIAEKKIIAWTVNQPTEMNLLHQWGVDGIISDHPERLARTFGRGAASGRKK